MASSSSDFNELSTSLCSALCPSLTLNEYTFPWHFSLDMYSTIIMVYYLYRHAHIQCISGLFFDLPLYQRKNRPGDEALLHCALYRIARYFRGPNISWVISSLSFADNILASWLVTTVIRDDCPLRRVYANASLCGGLSRSFTQVPCIPATALRPCRVNGCVYCEPAFTWINFGG